MCDEDDLTQCEHCGEMFEDCAGVVNEFVTLCDDCWYELHGDDEGVMDDDKGWL